MGEALRELGRAQAENLMRTQKIVTGWLFGTLLALPAQAQEAFPKPVPVHRARNVIVFVGDGMGVSTVSATRVYSVGVDGLLMMDRFPHTAISRTYTADHITPDSAGTISSMMTGVKANSGVLGFGPKTERGDFNKNGDTAPLWTLLELSKAAGMRAGVVTTARVTHATPAGTFAHVNDRDKEEEIALQALPGHPQYNTRLGKGIDLLMGGGRQIFVPATQSDEEGDQGKRSDGLDLRVAFQKVGYHYVHNLKGFDALGPKDLPVLGLFESSHMEWEYDRPKDLGKEPSLAQMTGKAIELLSSGAGRRRGYFLLVEGGRIDHAHHAGNAYRAITDTQAFDRAIEQALTQVNLQETLIIVTADHSHVFTMAGYPVRPPDELEYAVRDKPKGYKPDENYIFGNSYSLDKDTGSIVENLDTNQTPYTILGYQNGPGYRVQKSRVNPKKDRHLGSDGARPRGPKDPNYLQEAAVPLHSETHGGEEVVIYAWGPFAHLMRGTVPNTEIFEVVSRALGFKSTR